jgi:rare lipoprotein A
MQRNLSILLAGFLLAAPNAWAAGLPQTDELSAVQPRTGCFSTRSGSLALHEADPLLLRLLRYAEVGVQHRINGLASYYSSFFDGRKTANGEIFRNGKYSAAHLTLPLGTWIEVTARATGRKLRMRVNDRGPYAKKFCLDLSQAAARYLGVDVAPDRHVDVRIIALPGEAPLPEDLDLASIASNTLTGGTR